MSLHPLAGKKVPQENVVNIPNLISLYYVNEPDMNDPEQRVSFGTSGHRDCGLLRRRPGHARGVAGAWHGRDLARLVRPGSRRGGL